MSGVAPDLARLGQAVARAQDRELDCLALDTRGRLLERVGSLGPPRPAASRPLGRFRWPILAAAALALVVVGHVWLRTPELTFVVGETAVTGVADEWLAAPADRALPVRFSDGTTLTLEPSARARVVDTSDRGATVVVERGRVEADVVHRSGSHWSLRVGPYELRVHGTKFSAGWEPEAELLTVKLVNGALEVRGPGLEEGKLMAAGTRLEAHATDRRVELLPIAAVDPRGPQTSDRGGPADAATGTASLDDGPVPTRPDDEQRSDNGGGPTGIPGPARAAAGSWRKHFEAGRHREALVRARAEGFDRLCARSDAADLMALADVARFGGAPELATEALTTLRNRFPSDGRASVAAFLLGSIAFDHAGSPARAMRWFQTYLAEQPAGALAREAMGRLLEAAVRSGDGATARATARRYLDAYPTGPHAEQAERALAEP